MLKEYVADGASLQWTTVVSDTGAQFTNAVYLDGADGGPDGIRSRIGEGGRVEPHYHLGAQFQLLLSGSLQFPTFRLEAPAVHYTDHNVAYGPFTAGKDHEMMVLHAEPAGYVPLKDKAARKGANPAGRERTRSGHEVAWEPVLGSPGLRRKVLFSEPQGLAAELVECAPGTACRFTPPPYGRYEVVLSGSVLLKGRKLGPGSLRFTRGDEQPAGLVAGPEGAAVIALSYDDDVVRSPGGGSLAQDVARAMVEARARAAARP